MAIRKFFGMKDEAATFTPKKSEEARQVVDYRRQMEELLRTEAGTDSKERERVEAYGEEGAYVRSPSAAAEGAPGLTEARGFELPSAPEDMIKILSEQQGMEYVDLKDFTLGDPDVLRLIPSEVATTYKCLPIKVEADGTIMVAISDPLNIQITDDLQLLTGQHVHAVVAREDDILEFVNMYYGVGGESLENMVQELEAQAGGSEALAATTDFEIDFEALANQAPVIKLVNLLLMQAIKDKASDLHIEPFPNTLRIRYRVDGLLREIPSPPKSLQLGIISRFKVMANMNIAETKRPQDGRIKLNIENREVDLRVSTLPTVNGEGMAMRILDKNMMNIGINQLGMSKGALKEFRKVIKRPNGIILVTGPTGCGKTTTLYAAISEINDPGEKIITTEDPVEYEIPGLVQVNVNEKIGLSFERCLRSILRQDPDIVLVGEIRDVETAQISIQASLTGHLVLSTLHTNSAAATITRLLDMGIEPFLLTSTLNAVVGQRLVRTICPSCKQPYIPTQDELASYCMQNEDLTEMNFSRGDGCEECAHLGFKGRIGLFELMVVNEDIRELILQRESQDVIHHTAVKSGMMTMARDGWVKVCMGLTTFDEVARHTPKESQELIEIEMRPLMSKKKTAEVSGLSAPTTSTPAASALTATPPLTTARPVPALDKNLAPPEEQAQALSNEPTVIEKRNDDGDGGQ